jgi:hypothetical protein
MKKPYLLVFILWVVFVSGCGKAIYEASAQFSGDPVQFKFTLNPETPITYNIDFSIDYKCNGERETVFATITSPSGKEYSSSTTIGERNLKDCPLRSINVLSIKSVEPENGDFIATVSQEGTWNKINKVTLKVKK